jgi:hypothetical protein
LTGIYSDLDVLIRNLYDSEGMKKKTDASFYIDSINPENFIVKDTGMGIEVTKIDNLDFDFRPEVRSNAVLFVNMLKNSLDTAQGYDFGQIDSRYGQIKGLFDSAIDSFYLDLSSVEFMASAFKNFTSVMKARVEAGNGPDADLAERRKSLEEEAKRCQYVMKYILEKNLRKYGKNDPNGALTEKILGNIQALEKNNILVTQAAWEFREPL